ncbi:class I SAM-dependent DNA methyltransferase [Treponema sp. OMZ 799]|uniref:Eco57I restriction-modification methylase domain-containing protein n=1 Tax=Treponema sp. OMZ 799 TaxID=2563668 RepID=UPI0020A41144|nr:N-6 DNA methylase [Treponema sp. OMZ 799]UTC78840.1 class I SAM-dependent DNA methyltransferase [Treponema sp. OMZ 799]
MFNQNYPGSAFIMQNLLVKVFGKAYDESNEDLLESNPEYLTAAKDTGIESINKIAKFDIDRPLFIFDITVSDKINLYKSRVKIQNVVRRLSTSYTSYLIFFHYANNKGDWRISFVNKDDSLASTSAPKRYTYVVGENYSCRTVKERFEKLEKMESKTLKSVMDAFSVETLSNEFFDEYRKIYAKFVEFITGKRYEKKASKWEEKTVSKPNPQLKSIFEGDEKAVRDFVKKMMGRLVFLQFLQKKGWLGVPSDKDWGDGNKNYLQDLFTTSKEQDNFLTKVLDPLFFETLNNDRKEKDYIIQEILGKNQKIPYLNGGLFEADKFDKCNIVFSANLFKELFDFFARYNFTIDENDPNEKEIGVDPEMLGRIFENLLEDNKDKGAFYTPKEIVEYMCRESIIAYLITQTNLKEKDLRHFVLDSILNFSDKEQKDILTKLKNVKICDPAVGSGAFPMGILKELLHCRLLLEKNVNANTIKKEIVKNNIYGVDIEKGAIDIARLRFWLSIIVDEDIPMPLPNLDYKIMQGDSLIESYKGIEFPDMMNMTEKSPKRDMFGNLEDPVEELTFIQKGTIDTIRKNIALYFSTHNHNDKHKLKKEIEYSIRDHIKYNLALRKEKLHTDFDTRKNNITTKKDQKGLDVLSEKIKTLDAIHDELDSFEFENQLFFLWRIFFFDIFKAGGFDIVIANPPYIQLQDDNGKLSKLYDSVGYQSFDRTGDIYQLFYEKGINLLKEKGHLCYITSNKWMRAGYGEATRKFFAENTQPKILIDLAGEKVFKNATVDVNILLLQKAKYNDETIAITGDLSCLEKKSDLNSCQNHVNITFPKNGDSWIILSDIEQSIKKKIEAIGTPLKEWDIKIYRGILTGCNEAFIIDKEKRDELIRKCPQSAEIIRPILRGRDIKRYSYEFADLYLINTHNGIREKNIPPIDINDYPAIKEHLDQFWDKISVRDDRGKTPYNLRNCAYMEDFSKPRIAYCEIGSEMNACLLEPEIMINNKLYMVSGNNLEFLLLFFNSKLFNKIILRSVNLTGGKGTKFLHSIYTIKPNSEMQKQAKKLLINSSEKEKNEFINNIYSLTKTEIKYLDNIK